MNNAEISRAVREARRPLRKQIDMWRKVSVSVLSMSLGFNIGLYAISLSRESKLRNEIVLLQTELQNTEQVRDKAVQELGRMANDYALETLARQEQAEAYEALGAYRYIGECTITAYCPCQECCGRWADGLTATGLPAGPGIVAVDPDIIELGSTVVIDGQKYLAADTGSGVEGKHIDICMSSHEDTMSHSVRTAEAWVISP